MPASNQTLFQTEVIDVCDPATAISASCRSPTHLMTGAARLRRARRSLALRGRRVAELLRPQRHHLPGDAGQLDEYVDHRDRLPERGSTRFRFDDAPNSQFTVVHEGSHTLMDDVYEDDDAAHPELRPHSTTSSSTDCAWWRARRVTQQVFGTPSTVSGRRSCLIADLAPAYGDVSVGSPAAHRPLGLRERAPSGRPQRGSAPSTRLRRHRSRRTSSPSTPSGSARPTTARHHRLRLPDPLLAGEQGPSDPVPPHNYVFTTELLVGRATPRHVQPAAVPGRDARRRSDRRRLRQRRADPADPGGRAGQAPSCGDHLQRWRAKSIDARAEESDATGT